MPVRDEPLIIVGGRAKWSKKKEAELPRRKKRKYPNLGEKKQVPHSDHCEGKKQVPNCRGKKSKLKKASALLLKKKNKYLVAEEKKASALLSRKKSKCLFAEGKKSK